ncbi:MAG: hypothetical protein HOU81_26010 [Hamadaea sp.]|uniref:hypothetical protein n=1 Tax=Hamadaea sp. TaxID=2024425 RepID=UPI0017B8F7A2|nr:hypothetical protein [Hamadaea sp.]NUR74279.1 hypothetical protein [Hamadaea sp.]NUT21541.1 hypothetical protein [Hamadaea sp.]
MTGRHRSGQRRPFTVRVAHPRHLRHGRVAAPRALGLTLALGFTLLMISGYATAAGAVAIAAIFAP